MFSLVENKLSKTLVLLAGVLLFLLPASIIYAQSSASVDNDLVNHKFALFDANGKPFLNPYNDVAGTPFFMDVWKYGIIITDNNSKFEDIQFRIDLKDQQVHFKKPDNTEWVIQPGSVRQITLFDSSGKSPLNYLFQCGFPSIDNQNEKSFYQILADGKIKFLKSLRKTVYEEKDSFSGEVRKEFRQYEDYYFLVKNNMERIKRDKEYVLAHMSDKNSQIDAFLQKNKISFKSMDDIKKLVDYYNSL
jgi:hypothetical protein